MNSFTLTAVGNLACDPQLVRHRDLHYARLCLIGNDFVGRSADGATREIATRLAFLAYGAMGRHWSGTPARATSCFWWRACAATRPPMRAACANTSSSSRDFVSAQPVA